MELLQTYSDYIDTLLMDFNDENECLDFGTLLELDLNDF
jgi:hypothetical protein